MNPPSWFASSEITCGSWGIRTPGTINSYGSLANCWFQPLTQTSFRFVLLPQAFRLMRCKGSVLFLTAKTFAEKFLLQSSFFLYFAIPDIEQLIHIIYITISRRVDNKICFPLTTAVCKSCKRHTIATPTTYWRLTFHQESEKTPSGGLEGSHRGHRKRMRLDISHKLSCLPQYFFIPLHT